MKTVRLLALFCLLPAYLQAATLVNGIVATVNDSIITQGEFDERIRLIVAGSNLPEEASQDPRLRDASLRGLIDEKLKLAAAKQAGVLLSDQDKARGFAMLAQQNNFTPDEFSVLLKKQGVSRRSLDAQLEADLAWRKYIEGKLVPKVKVNPSEVDQTLTRLQSQVGKIEYNVVEIFLPVDQAGDESAVRARAANMLQQLNNGANFANLARSFSAGSAAAQGGQLGWISAEQLAPELQDVLVKMQPNQLQGPIRSLRGYHILGLQQTRTRTAETVPSKEQVFNVLANQQVDLLQRRALRDLRLNATIEVRNISIDSQIAK